MTSKIALLITLIWFMAFQPAHLNAALQDDSPKHETTVTIHLKISAEGMDKLPTGSTIELRGDPAVCKDVQRSQNIQSGEAMFPDVPKCKIDLRFVITGFNTQVLSVDFGKYKDPLQIVIKSDGPHILP